MAVKCVETGKVYETATDAARDVRVTPASITHVIKGRQKTAAGYRWVPVRMPRTMTRRYRERNSIRDDAGNVYANYTDLAAAKGISRQKAHRWVTGSSDGIFRNVWLKSDVTQRIFSYDGQWVVDGIRHATRGAAVRHSSVPAIRAHSALDKARRTGKDVTMLFGRHGWYEAGGDLFGEI